MHFGSFGRNMWMASYLLSSCQQPVVQEQKQDSTILSQSIVIERSSPSGADAAPLSIYQKFPPKYVVFPEQRPTPGESFHYGFGAGGTESYQTVSPYYIAAEPDFDGKKDAPIFKSRFDQEKFLSEWAEEFMKDSESVKRLDELAKTFRWQTDPAFIRDEEAPIPPDLLKNMQPYYKKTQRVLARRFTFLAAGRTELKPLLKGNEESVPLLIQEYSAAAREAGRLRYADPETGCVRCHGKGVFPGVTDPYVRHSSDYLAVYTDDQLIQFFKNSTFPSGELFADGLHVNAFASREDEIAMVAYLRSLKPSFDKIVELSGFGL